MCGKRKKDCVREKCVCVDGLVPTTRSIMLDLVISLDGKEVARSAVEFSAMRELTVTFGGGGIILSGADSMTCELDGCFSIEAPTPASASAEDGEWFVLPGTRQDRSTCAIDAPGFTICFDAAVAQSSSQNTVLRAVRVVRQQLASPTIVGQAPGPSLAHQASVKPSPPEEDALCIDAGDAESLPVLGRTAHGEWLRQQPRHGPPVLGWANALAGGGAADALREDACALVQQHGFGGRTFWISANEQPRCSLEQMALEVLEFHSKRAAAAADTDGLGGDDESFIGAEWWVQMRSVGTTHQEKEGEAGAASRSSCDGDDDDASSIAFHFDCDEGTFTATGELVPPWLSSITYLGDKGAPTLILPARPDEAGDLLPVRGVGAFLSYPAEAKHLAFDGTLLHGCPHVLSLAEGTVAATGGLRLTLLVNLWRRHRPCGPQRLPQRIAAALAATSTADGTDGGGGEAARLLPRYLAAGLGRADDAATAGVVAASSSATPPPEAAPHEVLGQAPPRRIFAPSARRRAMSPAARSVAVSDLPSGARLIAAARLSGPAVRLVHAPAVEVAAL